MDPLSAISSIIAILQLSTKVAHYVVGAKGATNLQMRLHEEIHGCEVILLQLKAVLDNEGSGQALHPRSISLLQGPHSPFNRLETLFESIKIKLAPRKGLSRVKSSLTWPFHEREVTELIAAIQREKGLLQLVLTEDSRDLLKRFIREAEENHDRLLQLVDTLTLQSRQHTGQLEKLCTIFFSLHACHENVANDLNYAQVTDQRFKILDWVTPTDFTSEQEDHIDHHQPGTCQWLLESSQFKAWEDGRCQTLYCPGIPGAGKTILTSVVIRYLQSHHRSQDVAVAYIYCNFRRRNEQTPKTLLAGILRQLIEARPQVDATIANLYNTRVPGQSTIPKEAMVDALQESIASFSRVFVLIDAIDEFDNSQGYRGSFLESLATIRDASLGKMSLFATSRIVPEIAENFKDSIVLSILATETDILYFTRAQMSRLPSFVRSRVDLQNEITAAIVRSAQGMFLLAKLHLESLIGSTSPKSLRVTLAHLPAGPSGYDYAYHNTMHRICFDIPQGQRDLAYQVLEWLTRAKRELTLQELQHAVAVEIDSEENVLDQENIAGEDVLVSACAGLVTVDRATGIIRLVHYTAQDFFERTQENWFLRTEQRIAAVCIKYLKFAGLDKPCKSDEEYETRLKNNPLYRYAAQNWGYHVFRSEKNLSTTIALDLLRDSTRIDAMSQALFSGSGEAIFTTPYAGYSQHFPRRVQGLHLAAHFNLEQLAHRLIDSQDVNQCDETGLSALMWAAVGGHVSVARLLVEHKADVDKRDDYGSTSFLLAARNGHVSMVEFLLLQGADPAATDTNGRTALSWAAGEGHAEVISTLLAYGLPSETLDGKSQSPLSWGARHGFDVVVKLLLEVGAEANQADVTGRTPLSWAVKYPAVVDLLFSSRKDVDHNVCDRYHRTPLSYAASGGYEATARLLLERGDRTSIDTRDFKGRTPLYWAARKGHSNIARLLLEYGCDADIADDQGLTPLALAHQYGDPALVSLLEESGASEGSSCLTGGMQSAFQELYGNFWSGVDRRHFIDIRGTVEEVEQLDPRYQVQTSHKFQPGEVFKIMWNQPRDALAWDARTVSTAHRFKNQYGPCCIHFQRFVVINTDEDYCTCLRIHTYGRRACKKLGVDPKVHGIVYEIEGEPSLLSGEPVLGVEPVPIRVLELGERIVKESRINFSEKVTVSYDVKVLFIGCIPQSHWKTVSDAVLQCQESDRRGGPLVMP